MPEGGIGSDSRNDESGGSDPAEVRREERLNEAFRQFGKITDALPDAMSLARAADGVIIDVNSAFKDVIGWSREEAIGKTAYDLALWPNPRDRDPVLRAFSDGDLRYIEHPIRRKDGTFVDGQLGVRSLELDGQAVHLFILRDISEQLRARRALEASEARLKALVQATFEGIAISEHGLVVDANEQLVQMFGMTRDEMIGNEVSLMVAPESRDEVAKKMRSGFEEPYEHFSIRKDGTVFPVEIRARAVDVEGRKLRMAAIRDITQRKQAEIERERLIAELTARNAEMEQFTYTVSHDLKSPLVTISGFLGMLERDIASGDKQRIEKDLARIGSATNKMMRLLTDLLELSRIGRVTQPKTVISLSEIVRDALELVSGPLAERRVRVDVAPMLPDVCADRVRLVQVVQNLLENAVKYMGDQPEPLLEMGLRPDASGIVFYVRDNGIGIDPRHHERIFGLFEKLDPKSEGTGVGLALVRRILEFHGGTIWVESAATGSTFVLRLPRVDGTEGDARAKEEG
jgi:PAS domain S-box-containing protein